jgi:hypothetical protein
MAGGKSLTKVIYKPDSQSTEEYIAIVDPVEVRAPSATPDIDPDTPTAVP